ncbi:hypothetical protein [Nocardia salmonicida]|uniref:hypothetical protein n=1 Tax=Nocardia salmonicida TaxID=53431 RepID=UPI0033F7B75F
MEGTAWWRFPSPSRRLGDGQQQRDQPEREPERADHVEAAGAALRALGNDDMDKIQPIGLKGRHVASRGPLPIPPSEQGQPKRTQPNCSSPTYAFRRRTSSEVTTMRAPIAEL